MVLLQLGRYQLVRGSQDEDFGVFLLRFSLELVNSRLQFRQLLPEVLLDFGRVHPGLLFVVQVDFGEDVRLEVFQFGLLVSLQGNEVVFLHLEFPNEFRSQEFLGQDEESVNYDLDDDSQFAEETNDILQGPVSLGRNTSQFLQVLLNLLSLTEGPENLGGAFEFEELLEGLADGVDGGDFLGQVGVSLVEVFVVRGEVLGVGGEDSVRGEGGLVFLEITVEILVFENDFLLAGRF